MPLTRAVLFFMALMVWLYGCSETPSSISTYDPDSIQAVDLSAYPIVRDADSNLIGGMLSQREDIYSLITSFGYIIEMRFGYLTGTLYKDLDQPTGSDVGISVDSYYTYMETKEQGYYLYTGSTAQSDWTIDQFSVDTGYWLEYSTGGAPIVLFPTKVSSGRHQVGLPGEVGSVFLQPLTNWGVEGSGAAPIEL